MTGRLMLRSNLRSPPLTPLRTHAAGNRSVLSLEREDLQKRKRIDYEGDVHVLCDVEEEMSIVATGNVAVWGRL